MSLADSPRWLYAGPGQLRTPWRLLTFGASLYLVQGIVESFLGPMFGWLSTSVGEPIPVYPWTMLAAVVGAVVVALRHVDDAPWSAVALGEGAWKFGAMSRGALLGALAIVVTAALLWVVGALRFETLTLADRAASGSGAGSGAWTGAWSGTAFRLLMLLAPAALWEELVFRGYLWHVAASAGGARVALWSSSLAFTAVHFMNPGANLLTTVAVFLAGLSLGLIRERFASLPAAWGAHLAWNWIMAAVLHVPVSGLSFATPGYRAVASGPDWLSGGVWGPEGSVIAALVMATALIWAEWPRRHAFYSTRPDHSHGAIAAGAVARS